MDNDSSAAACEICGYTPRLCDCHLDSIRADRLAGEVAALRAELASAEAECRDHAHRATAAEAERDDLYRVAADIIGAKRLTLALDAYREAQP